MNIGSSDEYGSNRAPQNEMQRESPISPYSFGKTASSHFLEMLNRIDNFPSCSLRLFLVYGPGQNDHRFIPQIIEGCLSDNIFNTSKGEQIRDFCFVEDIVEGREAIISLETANCRALLGSPLITSFSVRARARARRSPRIR